MRYLLPAVILACLSIPCFGQKDPIKFGEIPVEDLQMVRYDQDTSAVAVILADYGEARFSPFQGKILFERHTRIKILKSEGTSWADVGVDLYHDGGATESISGLKAVTYNLENGKIVETKMDGDAVFLEKFNKNINTKKFSLPNVKVGSVIEYSYKHNSDFIFNFPNWQFQYKIPSRYTEFRASIPDFFIMERLMQGYLAPQYDIKDMPMGSYEDKRHRWVIQNVPAFTPEPYMTSENDYVSKINFALAYINFPGEPSREIMGSWQKLVGVLMGSESFGKAITGNNFLKKKVEELTATVAEPEKKIQIIFDYVKSALKWNNVSDISADNLKDVFEKGMGSSGDINIALASMLDKAGFEVDPIVLSTRDHGFIRVQAPMQSQLNYVVCSVKLNGKRILMDATEKFLPLNVLPERCLNGQGILILKEAQRFEWMNLEAMTKSKTVTNCDLALTTTGELKGKITFTRDGYDAHRSRKRYAEGEEDYVKKLMNGKSWEIEKSQFQTMTEVNVPVKETHELTINDNATVSGDVIYLNPLMGFSVLDNPFKIESRLYPVDFGSPFERVVLSKITIPEGYVIDEIPQNKIIALPNGHGKFVYSITVLGNIVNCTSSLSVNKALFIQAEYPLLREFYTQFIAKQSEQVVLKKK
jgi:Domain of Unknown Function with PDB structure (DUF3857)